MAEAIVGCGWLALALASFRWLAEGGRRDGTSSSGCEQLRIRETHKVNRVRRRADRDLKMNLSGAYRGATGKPRGAKATPALTDGHTHHVRCRRHRRCHSPACGPTVPSSSVRWRNTKISTGSATSAAPMASSSRSPNSSAEPSAPLHRQHRLAALSTPDRCWRREPRRTPDRRLWALLSDSNCNRTRGHSLGSVLRLRHAERRISCAAHSFGVVSRRPERRIGRSRAVGPPSAVAGVSRPPCHLTLRDRSHGRARRAQAMVSSLPSSR